MIITRTPLRISLCGGATDVPAFYRQHPGCVVSFAINKFVYVSVNKKFDNAFRVSYSKTENVKTIAEIEHDIVRETLKAFDIKTGLEITSVSDIPGNGTGLGSSSAFTVGLIKTLQLEVDWSRYPGKLAERAFRIEFDMCGHPVGRQDQLASAYGGMNILNFRTDNKVGVREIRLGKKWIEDFESHSLLLWTGRARDANEILETQKKGFQDGSSLQMGIQMARLAQDFYNELVGGADMKRVGEFISTGWVIKKLFARDITNMLMDSHYAEAMKSGAYGGKLLGAGGGGFLFFIAPPDTHKRIVEVTGLRKVPFKIEMEGSKVIYGE